MLSYCTDYAATMPNIVVYMNCDTRLAINLRAFNLNENDEFIFAIKNYSYINSPYVYLFRARASDVDANGEVLFKITPSMSKHLKPGAFYNFAVLKNAFDRTKETEYKKLTDNGNVIIEYGAQDILVYNEEDCQESEIISVRLEPIDSFTDIDANPFMGEIVGLNLEFIGEK
jgi:hypothetical protein